MEKVNTKEITIYSKIEVRKIKIAKNVTKVPMRLLQRQFQRL